MSSTTPHIVHWGIIGTGWISSEFAKDLALERDVDDVYHSIVAVGSRSPGKADKFIEDFIPQGTNAQKKGLTDRKPKPYATYNEVYNHPDVDIIYIGTPNTAHYDDCLAALQAGKNCLLEKPATLNAAEWNDLARIAKEKRLFLMEAVWTRFQPLSYTLQNALHKERVIGDLRAVHSDFSIQMLDVVPDTHRAFNPQLAGGALLDLGVYTILQAILALYHHPDNESTPPSKVTGAMLKAPRTDVDMSTTVSMEFPKIQAMACLSCSFAYNTDPECATRITGTKGTIIVSPLAPRPTKFIIREERVITGNPFEKDYKPDVVVEHDFPGFGLYWEADAVARSLRDGELENPRMPHAETKMTMEIFDEIRRQGGYTYPEGLVRIEG